MTDWRKRVAAIAQAEFEDSMTSAGHVAHAEYLGERIASALAEVIEPLLAEIEEGGRRDTAEEGAPSDRLH